MENVSRVSQINPYDTAFDESISLYLSFNNSSMADKTVEADDKFFDRDEDRENCGTVIKKSVDMTPLRKAPKSILQEINAYSSTPTHPLKEDFEQIQKGMAALGLIPLDQDVVIKKESILSQQDEVLGPVFNKSLEVTNIERQKCGETFDSDDTVDDKFQNIVTVNSSSDDSNMPSVIVVDDEDFENSKKHMNGDGVQNPEANDKVGVSPSPEIFRKSTDAVLLEVDNTDEENKENLFKKTPEVNDGEKRNSGAHPKNKRRSSIGSTEKKESVRGKRLSTTKLRKSLMQCEPNLNFNRPSRIEVNKRYSSLVERKKSSAQLTDTSIPKLIKTLGLPPIPISKEIPTFKAKEVKQSTSLEELQKYTKPVVKRKSMIPPPPKNQDIVKRKSVVSAPSGSNLSVVKEKMSTILENSPKRLPKKSGVLKTTLNRSTTSRLSTAIMTSKLTRHSLMPVAVKSEINLATRPKSPINKKQTSELKDTHHAKPPSSSEVFACDKCPKVFRLLSSLEAHKLTHDPVSPITKCKYCDKKFAFKMALKNHLLEKCLKIPLVKRKELLYPLSKRFYNDIPKRSNNIRNPTSNKSGRGKHIQESCLGNTVAPKTTPPDSRDMPPPPSSSKSNWKAPPAHSGVYRTPSKPIVCYTCKKNFNTVLDFTQHMMSEHSHGEAELSGEV